MNQNKISVIVPIYSEDFAKSIESLQNQVTKIFEIILVDLDYSRDITKKIFEYCNRFENISSFSVNAKNIIPSDLLHKTQGEYIVFVHSKDFLESNFTTLLNETIIKDNFPDLVGYAYDEFIPDNNTHIQNILDIENFTSNDCIFNNSSKVWAKAYKKKFLKDFEINFSTLKNFDDYLFNFKTFFYATTISYIPDMVYHHSIVSSKVCDDETLRTFVDNFQEIKEILIENGSYEDYEEKYLSYVLTEFKDLLSKCSENRKNKLFNIIKQFLVKQKISNEILKKLPFDLYQLYIHLLVTDSYYEFVSYRTNKLNSEGYIEDVLLNQIFSKNEELIGYESRINELEYYKKILFSISKEFDKQHFFEYDDYNKIQEMNLFDEDYYLQQNNYGLEINPLLHYLYMGHFEGKNPSEIFDGSFYARFNKNVSQYDTNPLLYFVKRGMNEGLIKINKDVWQPEHISKYELDEQIKTFDKMGITKNKRNPRLIVSLTSFPERMYDIHYCLYSLLNQRLKPDLVVLWLAEEEFPNGEYDIPSEVLKLKQYGLEIRFCENLMSFKKLIPSLIEFPDDIIVTADDDVYYPEDWLELLYGGHTAYPEAIISHRARIIKFDEDYEVEKYYKWTLINENTLPSSYYLFTGSGGVLYPPNSLNQEIFNKEKYLNEYGTTDDIWFWAMAVLNNTKIKTIKNDYNDFAPINPARLMNLTNEKNLFSINKDGKNFENMKKILEEYPYLIKNIKNEKKVD